MPKFHQYASPEDWHQFVRQYAEENLMHDPRELEWMMQVFERKTGKICPERRDA